MAFSVYGQSNPPKKEVRGAWIATVINLDWPSTGSASVSQQKEELIFQLDELNAAGINLVFFQVRAEGDAFYDSDIEPWSKYLTGQEGRAPDPYWDPLAFAIEEAHKRGMEMHAWLNPYRAMRSIPSDFTQKAGSQQVAQNVDESLSPFLNKEYDINTPMRKLDTQQRDSMHVSNTHPEWLLVLNNAIAIFDPGLPEVMDYNLDVLMDIVNRYDVDGIHFDDYFYPYPPNHMSSSAANNALDDDTFADYPRGFTDKNEWRRNNIDIFVEMVYDSIQVVKPWVKFGISPFGLWKNGTPSGTFGMDAHNTIYADALAWLEDHTMDYVTPQLYWPFGGGQDYGKLAPWWAEQAAANDRHIYPGHGLYRTDRSTFSNTLFAANEIPRQIRLNRNHEDITGSVFFRSQNITHYSSKGFADSLKNNYYRYAALQPTMAWKDTSKPNTPLNFVVERDAETDYEFNLSWDRPDDVVVAKANLSSHIDTLIKYAVYRVDKDVDPNEMEEIQKAENLIAVTGETSFTDITPPSANDYYYFVTAVTRNNIESDPSEAELGGFVEAESIDLLPETIALDTTMNFAPTYTVRTSDGVAHKVDRDKISWSLTNPAVGEISEKGKFTPTAVGETGLVATLNVASDTVWIEVVQKEGYFVVNDFLNLEEWTIETSNLDNEQIDVSLLENGEGLEVSYTLPGNTSNVKISFNNSIAIDGVPSFANVKGSGDGNEYGVTVNIANPDSGLFLMESASLIDSTMPETVHFTFSESETSRITAGASFYFPFTLEGITITLPDNETDEEVQGYFRLLQFGVSYTDTPVSIEEESGAGVPDQLSLSQNYPNPFNPTTNITFNLPSANRVELSVFDILGRKVVTLVDGRLQSGNHTYNFDASKLSSGIYIYRLQSGEVTLTEKMTLIK
ncbi:MAG: family 10 glycosylhydrolase [Balneolaceae bacterium]